MRLKRQRISRILLIALLLTGGFTGFVHATNYYISSKNGNDNNAGTSSGAAWKTLDRLSRVVSSLRAGDVVYLEKGSEWEISKLRLSNLTGSASSPILFTTYGSGNKPRIKGSKTVTSFSQSGNIWRAVDNYLPDYNTDNFRFVTPFIYINGARMENARYPNTGYLKTNTTGSSRGYLEDAYNQWPENYWKNGIAAVQAVYWIWDTKRINYNSGSALYFDDLNNDFDKDSSRYLIRNHVHACDLQGEWAQQNDTLWVNYSGNLNQQKVEVPVVDTIVRISNCQYVKFDGISFERANLYLMHAMASNITVQNCTFSDAGASFILTTDHCTVNINSNTMHYGRRGGIYMQNSHGTLSKNAFKQMAFEGAVNGNLIYGTTIANWYCDDKTYITQNTFDSVNIGVHSHYSNAESFITKNVFNHYGRTIKDCGAVYIGTDFTEYTKHVNRNIILNSEGTFVHGIYVDYNSRNVVADSNSIMGSNQAIYLHVSMNNSFKYNNIVKPSIIMSFPYATGVRFDEYVYNLGLGEVVPIQNNELLYNNIVLGQGSDELAAMYFDVRTLYSNRIDYNNYFDPFGSDDRIIGNGDDYYTYRMFNLSDWSGMTGMEYNSTYNKTNWTYSSNLGISKDNFVLMLTNPSNAEIIYDLRSRGAEYIDVNGTHYSQTIKIPAYYSVILFYYKKSEGVSNQTPVIVKQSFQVEETSFTGDFIGKVFASDPDAGQKVSYAITGGNTNNLFRIDALTGNLYFVTTPVDFSNTQLYTLTVQVTDNGTPALSSSAQVTVQIIPLFVVIHIDPSLANSSLEDGSILHPFNSWTDVTFEEGKTYLQKAGTREVLSNLSLNSGNLTIGAYGTGDNPQIAFTTSDYGIRIFNLQNIRFEKINFQAPRAVSCIYMLGSESNNIDISGCTFTNSKQGVRSDGGSVSISYSEFEVEGSGVISYAASSRLYYNLFRNSAQGVVFKVTSTTNYLYNNMFYGNGTGVQMDSAGLMSFNNVFYQVNPGDIAIEADVLPENSNHNLYYPDQSGFITISGVPILNLKQYQSQFWLEGNSLNIDPQLINPDGGDFSVQPESPVIDAGRNLGILVDFAGNTVPNGGSTDIGLYEREITMPDPRIVMYPNPTSGIVNILMLNGQFEGGVLTIYSLSGMVVKTITIPEGNAHTLDIRNIGTTLDKGSYLLRIDREGATPFNQKLIIL